MAGSLSISSNNGYTDFNFSIRNDAKDSDNGNKKPENSRLAYDEVQEDTLPLAKIKILMKINLVLLDNTVSVYLTWRNLQFNHMLHVVTLKDINSFIQMSWMNLFLTHFAVNAKAILCNSERRCEKRTWWTFSCLFDVYLFSRFVDECLTDAVADKIQNYYGVAIQSNTVKLKDMQNTSGKWYIFTWSLGPSNETLNQWHQYYPITLNSWCKYQVDQLIIQVFTTNKTVCHPSFAVVALYI